MGKEKTDRGEMRRRFKALIASGTLGRLRSEGRLMACYILYYADFTTCRVRVSGRGAATTMGVSPTTVRRGVSQLMEASVLSLVAGETGSRPTYEVLLPPGNGGHEPCAERTRAVSGVVTSRVRSVHERCARRTRAVSTVDTSGDPIQVFPIGSNLTNWGNTDSPTPRRSGLSSGGAEEAGT